MVLFVVTCIYVFFDPCLRLSFVSPCLRCGYAPKHRGIWACFLSVADATAHLKEQGTKLFTTQVCRVAKNTQMRGGWQFRSTSPDAGVPSPPTTSDDMGPDSGQRQGGVLTFFTLASELAACGSCGQKLLGDIVSCPCYG